MKTTPVTANAFQLTRQCQQPASLRVAIAKAST
jgi:hypothetical protein